MLPISTMYAASRVLSRARDLRERVTNSGPIGYVRESPTLSAAVRGLGACLVVGAALGVVVWWARWDAARDRDGWWRAEIARASSGVRHVITERGQQAIITDRELIGGLTHHDEKLAAAEAALDALRRPQTLSAPESAGRSVPGRADRCSLPADCLR